MKLSVLCFSNLAREPDLKDDESAKKAKIAVAEGISCDVLDWWKINSAYAPLVRVVCVRVPRADVLLHLGA